MAKFLFKRSEEVPGLPDVELETELNPESLAIIEEIRKLQRDRTFINAWAVASTVVREYRTKHVVPYGYSLKEPKGHILAKVAAARDFIVAKETVIQRETPDCAGIMKSIADKANHILELESGGAQ